MIDSLGNTSKTGPLERAVKPNEAVAVAEPEAANDPALAGDAVALTGAAAADPVGEVLAGQAACDPVDATAFGAMVDGLAPSATTARDGLNQVLEKGSAYLLPPGVATVRNPIGSQETPSAQQLQEAAHQLQVNAELEREALAALTPEQQATYQRLADATAAAPLARLSLQVLAIEGKLSGELLDQLGALESSPMHPDLDPRQVLQQTIHDIATPASIMQGSRGTCVAGSALILLAGQNPAEYVRLVNGLASPEGKVTMANGDELVREPGTTLPDGSNRAVPSRLLQAALMEYGNGDKDYEGGFKDDERRGNDLRAWVRDMTQPGQTREEIDAAMAAEPKNYLDTNVGANGQELGSGLVFAEQQRVLAGLFGNDAASSVFLDVKPDATASTEAQREATRSIEASLAKGQPAQVAMYWGEPDADGKVHGAHAVAVTGMTADTVTLTNPWGEVETMPRTEFEKRVYAVHLLEA